MKTSEKTYNGIKITGFGALLIMLILIIVAVFLFNLPHIANHALGLLCTVCFIFMIPGFIII